MSLEQFIGHFSESLEELPDDPLTGETVFKDLKVWDSLAVLTVTDTIDMEYGVLLKKADYADCATVAALYDLVQSRR